MNIKFTTKLTQLTEEQKARMTRQFTKFDKLLDGVYDVKCRVEKKPNNQFKVELTVITPRLFRVEEYADNVYDAADLVESKMYRMLRKHKERKLTTNRRPKCETPADEFVDEPIESHNINRIKYCELKPMTESEAVDEMYNTSHDFYVFRNAEDGNIEIAYSRRDGSAGILILVE